MAREVLYGQEDGVTQAASTIDGILKEDYVIQNIIDTVNMAVFLLTKMKMERTTAGRRFVFPLRFGVGEGQGNRAENTPLPEAGFGEYDQAFGNVKSQYGVFSISGQSMSATEGGRATFVSALKQALKDCRDGFRLETHRQAWGDGTGTIALVNGTVTASTTVPLKDPFGLSYSSADLEASQKTRLVRKGMKVWFKTSNVIRTIDGINGDGSIEVDTAVTLVDGEKMIRGDSATENNENKEYLGVNGGVKDTGDYLGVPRAGEPNWQGNIIDAAGAPLDEDLLQHAFDIAEIHGDGVSRPDMLMSEHRVRRIYLALLQAQKRFTSPTVLKGGFSALDFNGVPWVVDRAAPPQRVFYLNSADWVWFVMQQIAFDQRDGSVLKWVSGRDAFQAFLKAYREMVCKQPANQTVLENILN